MSRWPLAEEVKVTLKVSQNLHASMTPYVLGALVNHARGRGALAAGFDAERVFLERAGLDLIAAAQGDGAGGAPGAFYSPNFMTQYLAYMALRPDSAVFRRALPIWDETERCGTSNRSHRRRITSSRRRARSR